MFSRRTLLPSIALMCVLSFAIPKVARAAGFITAPTYAVGTSPSAGAVGDVNGDGFLDIVTVNSVGGNLSTLLGIGNGKFSTAINSGSNLGGSLAITLGDFNGDGYLDVAVVSGPSILTILLGTGTGGFTVKGTVSLPSEGFSVAVGDFNGDGKLDVVTANLSTQNVSILLGKGDGTFQSPLNLFAGSAPKSVAVADVNNDGKLDLAVANFSFSGGGLDVLLGNGDGTFQAATSVASGMYDWVTAADLNLDGKADLVAVGNTTTATVFLGNGNGTFQNGVAYSSGSSSTSVAAGDLNGDGKPDLIVGRQSGISTMLGNGDGSFQLPVEYASGGFAEDVLLGDFNGDLKLDAATPNFFVDNVSVFLNKGQGTFPAARQYEVNDFLPISSAAAVAANFNSDGNKDIAVLTNGSQTGVHVLLGNGDGTFQSPVYTAVGINPTALAAGDFNKDHKLDLAVADGSEVIILSGNGDGTFQVAASYSSGGSADGVTVADVNKDGNLDLLVATTSLNAQFNNLVVFLGNGDGTFQAGVSYRAGSGAHSVAVGDINNDGKLDAVVGAFDINGGLSKDVFIFLGNGDGTFQTATSLKVQGSTDGIALADFNKDGKLDLAVDAGNETDVLLGNGDGTFQSAKSLGLGGSGLKVLDVNGDGKLDLAVADFKTNTDVFLGNGDGTFKAAKVFSAAGLALTDTADFNHDGAPDLVQVTFLGNSVTVLLNTR